MNPSGKMGTVKLDLPSIDEYEQEAFFCLGTVSGELQRQGDSNGKVHPWLKIIVFKALIPQFVMWILVIFLLFLSGLFSGLNLGILSLDKMDLKIIINTGTTSQRRHAKKIRPIREHGNLLLCSLVFSNVLVNSTLTLLIDELTDEITSVIWSTFAIVIFGEIIPQAVCSRYGMAVGGYTIWITKFFMFLTFPLAFPMSKILDWCLGEEIGMGFTRERLKELVKVMTIDAYLLFFIERSRFENGLNFCPFRRSRMSIFWRMKKQELYQER